MNPQIYSLLIFDKAAKLLNEETRVSSINGVWKTG